MKKQFLAVLAAFVLMPLIGLAQTGPKVVAKIPFRFVVEGRTLASGPYEFKLIGTDLDAMRITNTKTNHAIVVPIVAPAGLEPTHRAEVVFDKAGKSSYLSEVIIPGMDGYLIAGPTGEHQQTSVPGTN